MTLFELSVVVTITIILAGLAVYSAQNLYTRTKVSRAREDQRALSRALQNYALDYSILPSYRQGFSALTHPTAYLGSVPSDPFQNGSGTYLYLIPDSQEISAIIISPGPDGDFDLPTELWRLAAGQDINQGLVPVRESRRMTTVGALLIGTADGQVSTSSDAIAVQSPDERFTDAETAILSTYLKLGGYSPEKGSDGDIFTVIRF